MCSVWIASGVHKACYWSFATNCQQIGCFNRIPAAGVRAEGAVSALALCFWSTAHGLQSPCFVMKSWWGAGGQRLRLCLCGLLSGLIGNRCGKAGGRAASQSSWEKLKTTAFLETGGITVRGRVGCKARETEESSVVTVETLCGLPEIE